MQVIDHERYAWFLLDHGGNLFLDVHCSHSFFDYTVLIALTSDETQRYRLKGRDYLHVLAQDVHYSAPAVRGSKSPYKERNLTVKRDPLNAQAQAAISAWLKLNPAL